MTTLRELQEGEKGIITKVKGRGAFRRRIIEMGFIKGKEVTVEKAAPLRDPVEYKIMDYEVTLRRSEAGLIEVVTPQDLNHQESKRFFNGFLSTGTLRKKAKEKGKTIDVALVGNPNSGKTTLFNSVSRSREHVGNYGGVTVDAVKARFKQSGYTFNITDLPGTYSLTDYSPEELFVRKHIFSSLPDVVINVIDASNLERNLYLTTQLIDMDIKVVGALNMYDELEKKGDQFDYVALGKMIGIPLMPTVSSKKKGFRELFQKVIDIFEDRDPDVRHVHINYGNDLERSLKKIQDLIWVNRSFTDKLSSRYYSIKLFEKDKSTDFTLSKLENYGEIRKTVDREIKKLEDQYGEDSATLVTDAKYGFIAGALKETYTPASRGFKTGTKKLDHILTSRYLSYPIFIFFMWFMFEATFFLGQYPMIWLEKSIAILGSFVSGVLPDNLFKALIVDGIIGGVGGVIIFLPNILILFLFIALMEDTGYMARVAFILDKLMHKVGLHGKSFIPLLMGFGCNVPAILATRTIESRNDRFVTILINPFMSCSARYPVYVLLISAFFKEYRGLILFGIYLFGIFMAAIVALVLKKTLFKANEMPFVMELPPYRTPTVKSTLRHTWFRGSQYLKKMGGIILLASIIIWALGYFPRNEGLTGEYDQRIEHTMEQYDRQISLAAANNKRELRTEKTRILKELEREKASRLQEKSFIGRMGKFIAPVIHPLGFDWKMGVSLIAGIAAKEVVVSTMGVLYQTESGEEFDALPQKLEKEYRQKAYGKKPGYNKVVALSFMVFILLYLPCIAVLTAVRKETGTWKWALFLALYTTALAWITSFLVFQLGNVIFLG